MRGLIEKNQPFFIVNNGNKKGFTIVNPFKIYLQNLY